MKRDGDTDQALVSHILECINRVELYTVEGQDGFCQSSMTQDAVVRNLQIMSESTQRLSDRIKKCEPDIPWRKIAGFRNIITHDYFDIDEDIVWTVIEQDLPVLKRAIVRMANALQKEMD